MNVLLGITGSVASIYTNQLVDMILNNGHDVYVVYTNSGIKFAGNLRRCARYGDQSETWSKMGDEILHIELRNWADIMVIAPLSANTLSKIATGQCDSLLTEVVRAWDFNKPIIACPAMNTSMWENDPTSEQVATLRSRGFDIIDPIVKTLACGDRGVGAMCMHETITDHISDAQWWNPLDGYDIDSYGKKFFIPELPHPGAFGAVRKHDVHTGVDLYTKDGANVYAMEDGEITNIAPFTGASLGFPHWEETDSIFVSGKFGVINYGEVTATRKIGDKVKRGERIGKVKRVLPFGKERPDIPNHSLSMLHLEYYKPGTTTWVSWELDGTKPSNLRNPTHRLKLI